MRINISIDEALLREAQAAASLTTVQAVVEEGLRQLVQVKRQEEIRKARGTLRWEGDLGATRLP